MTSQLCDPRPDHLIVRAIWPVLLAAVVGLFPFTIYSTFLVPIATDSGIPESLAGSLRGLGGVAALMVGVASAPLIARWSAPHTTAVGLGLLSITSLAATWANLTSLIVFCVGIGAATAILTPALLAIATGGQSSPADSGRAATLVTATQSLAAVLAAPVIGVVGLWHGWHGALWGTAAVAALVAVWFVRSGPIAVDGGARLEYRDTFRRLRGRRDLLALMVIAFLRTTAFMGYLAFLATHYHHRFGLTALDVTLVWTLSGASFFIGNFLAGRWASRVGDRGRGRLLVGGLAAATVAVAVVFSAEWLTVALVATVVMGFGHAVVAALVTTAIAHRGGDLTTPAYSLNAAGMSLGVFAGALVGGLGLALSGTVGLTVALTLPTVVALLSARIAVRRSG
ncbi:putative MFS family arabinose efflux permease [Stackebrandtia endophytica]|uniref:Putative MFS family arabinose efflux permease n=1 Tax=Stackebrandtia endophytica TaxID=1496996 RepID=A0A543B025_9ACTN|nr:MFS transporter [Stackebrandtia endophytica]TQL78192.1 putative MFS family arabinose efflux permease [Stackebrandtia endophytica]